MPLSDDVRLRVSRTLESGAWDGPVARVLSHAWGAVAARSLVRRLVWPRGARGIVVGGATLGGSGKTPLAIACAREAARCGARVALVAHGYRASVEGARVVRADDDVRVVGDEALVAARALRGVATVVVARRRQEAIDRAAQVADVIVVDGVLQTAPERAWLSLLAVDAEAPWGSGEVVPRGDLRAPREAVVGVVDRVVFVGFPGNAAPGSRSPHPGPPPKDLEEGGGAALVDGQNASLRSLAEGRRHPPPDLWGRAGVGASAPGASSRAPVLSRGAFVSSRLLPWSSLSALRLGLFTALARPSRLLTSLARHGLTPAAVVSLADHATPSAAQLTRRLSPHAVDLWLASPKCATRLESAHIPHARLEYDVALDESLALTLGMGLNDPSVRVGAPRGSVLPRVPS